MSATWWPVGHKHVAGEDEGGTRHAIGTADAMAGNRRAVCGAELVRPCSLVRFDGEREGNVVAEWPPFAFRRCPTCFAQTGRPRVDKASAWRRQDRPS